MYKTYQISRIVIKTWRFSRIYADNTLSFIRSPRARDLATGIGYSILTYPFYTDVGTLSLELKDINERLSRLNNVKNTAKGQGF